MRNSPSSMSAKAIRLAILRNQTTSTKRTQPTLIQLTIWLQCAETQVRNGKLFDNGDLWYRGWKRSLELREQIDLLQNVAGM